MMPPCPQAEDLAVEHVGESRQRMPVRGMSFGPCPVPILCGEPGGHVPFIEDVDIVVKVQERCRQGWNESDRDRQIEQAANDRFAPPRAIASFCQSAAYPGATKDE